LLGRGWGALCDCVVDQGERGEHSQLRQHLFEVHSIL